jgi:hypothetical protein
MMTSSAALIVSDLIMTQGFIQMELCYAYYLFYEISSLFTDLALSKECCQCMSLWFSKIAWRYHVCEKTFSGVSSPFWSLFSPTSLGLAVLNVLQSPF